MATARVNNCFDSIIDNGVELLPKEAALAVKHFDEAPRKVHTNVKRYLKQVGALIQSVKDSGDSELLELLGLKAERKARGAATEETPVRGRRGARGEESQPVRNTRKSKEKEVDDFDLDEDDEVEEKPKRGTGIKRGATGKLQTVKSPLRRTKKVEEFDDEDEVPASRVKKQARQVRRPRIS